jgi:hypothetical protein
MEKKIRDKIKPLITLGWLGRRVGSRVRRRGWSDLCDRNMWWNLSMLRGILGDQQF